MRLTSKGIPNHISKSLCKKAIKFYAKYLLSVRLYETISIHVEFIKYEKHEYAYCNPEDEYNRTFLISINKNLSKEDTLRSIAHEMVHVKQYVKRELKHYTRGDKVKFLDEFFIESKTNYWIRPWEKEARALEEILYEEFVRSEEYDVSI